MTLNEFHKQMLSGGAWALAEPSEPIKRLIAHKKIKNPAPNVEMYSIIQKYIETEDRIIIVSLASEELQCHEGCGVEVYRKEDVCFIEENDKIYVTRKAPLCIEVSSNDYLVADGFEDVVTPKGRVFRIQKEILSPTFWEAVFATNTLTAAENAAYNSLLVAINLPRIVERFVNEEPEITTTTYIM